MNNILPIILLLSSVGLFFGYINPTYTADTLSSVTAEKSIKELKLEKADYEGAILKTREIEVARKGLLAKYNAIDEKSKEKMNKLLPDHIDSVRLIIDINNIAQKYGMSLTNLIVTATGQVQTAPKAQVSGTTAAPSAEGPSGPIGPDNKSYDSMKLGFTITGKYANFIQFLKELEESLRVVDVTSLSFNTTKNALPPLGQTAVSTPASSSDIYTYTMTIRTYFLK